MCRLAAIVKQEAITAAQDNKLRAVFSHLLYMNSYNNVDGTGVMCQSFKTKTLSGHKRSIPSPDFINSRWYQKTFLPSFFDQQFIAGHTRYSTVGGNSDENSHPFLHGSYFLMQNGTALGNSHANLVTGKHSPHAVDSENVAWAFAQQGIKKTLEKYKGEGVLMFMDKSKGTFNIIKNEKRELCFAMVKDFSAIIIATERFAIETACARAGLEILVVEDLANDVHHQFFPDGSYKESPMVIDSSYSYQPYRSTAPIRTWDKKAGKWMEGVDSSPTVGKQTPQLPKTTTGATGAHLTVVGAQSQASTDLSLQDLQDLEQEEAYKGAYVDACMLCGLRLYEEDEIFIHEETGAVSCEGCVDIVQNTFDVEVVKRGSQ